MIVISELIIIFIAKVIEVSLTTLRMVFVGRGEKFYASAIGFVEIIIWLNVASVVLVNINENPAKMVTYALGFALGSFVGLTIEDKIGLGYANIQIITDQVNGLSLATSIRELGRAVTVLEGEGKDSKNLILTTFVKRKDRDTILSTLKDKEVNGLITVAETQKIYGGFGIK